MEVSFNIGEEKFFSRLALLDEQEEVQTEEVDDLVLYILRKRQKLYHIESKGQLEDTLQLENRRNKNSISLSDLGDSSTNRLSLSKQ